MEKRPLVIIKGKTIDVCLPDGFNLVVNGEAFVGTQATVSMASPDILAGLVPAITPEIIVVAQEENAGAKFPPPPSGTPESFFDTFEALRKKVPRSGLQCVNNENSPYCQYTEESKNCYMTFASYYSEDCMYNTRVLFCRDCNDSSFLTKCELCYECIDCTNCYNCNYCLLCERAVDCSFCVMCFGAQNCFGCVGLPKKSFHIFNQPYSKEEYVKKVSDLKRLPLSEIIARMQPLLEKTPRPAIFGKNNEDSFGDKIFNCKNVYAGFDSENLHDATHVYHCADSKDLVDCSNLGWSEQCYEIMSGGKLTDCQFCFGCWNSNNMEYCELVYNSHDCFGCIGLNHAEYCIFNVQYSKEEYAKRLAEIKTRMKRAGEYGKWFTTSYPEGVLTAGLV